MIRQSFAALILATAVLASSHAATFGDTSESKVKATATSKKSGADGKQVVTITLDVEKGWYIYANPINANTEVLKENETKVTFQAKDKVMGLVQFPKGKEKMDNKYKFDIYEGQVVIQAELQRTMGDGSPLEVSIHVNACRKGECLLPGVIKLKVK